MKSFYSTKNVKKKLGRAFLCSGVFLGFREGGEAEFQVIFLLLKTKVVFFLLIIQIAGNRSTQRAIQLTQVF